MQKSMASVLPFENIRVNIFVKKYIYLNEVISLKSRIKPTHQGHNNLILNIPLAPHWCFQIFNRRYW